MVKQVSMECLRKAFDALSQREDGGAGLTLAEVCGAAKVSRATAYRGDPSFKSEFDARIARLKEEATPGRDDPVKPDTRSGYRRYVAKLSNQVQVLALELEAERRRKPTVAAIASDRNVVAFPQR